MLGVTWQHKDLSVEAWNYYINDFVNSVYLVGQYSFEPTASDFIDARLYLDYQF